jgi:hypothetical protein
MPENCVLFFQNEYHPNAKRGANFGIEFGFPHVRGVAFHNGNAFFASGVNEG